MLIFAAIVAIFVYGMIAAMLGTILPDLSDRFHLSPSQNGTIAFAQAWGSSSPRSPSARCSITKARRSASFSAWRSSRSRSSPCRARRASAASASAVPARRRRRHRGDRRKCAGQRCRRGASRYRAEPRQSLLRPRRTRHALHLRQSLWAQLGPPLLHRRLADCRHAGDSGCHQNARAHRRRAFRARRGRSCARPPAALHAWTFSFSLRYVAKSASGTGCRVT